MPTVDQHIEQWKHNRRFAGKIDAAYRDWQINVIFYAALHLVDAAPVHLRIRVSNHEERNTAVRSNVSLSAIRIGYLDLYRISKITRYDADPHLWLPARYLEVEDLAKDLLQPIEFEVEKLLGRKLNLSPLKVSG